MRLFGPRELPDAQVRGEALRRMLALFSAIREELLQPGLQGAQRSGRMSHRAQPGSAGAPMSEGAIILQHEVKGWQVRQGLSDVRGRLGEVLLGNEAVEQGDVRHPAVEVP